MAASGIDEVRGFQDVLRGQLGTTSKIGMENDSPWVRQSGNICYLLMIGRVGRSSV
jgi:hypothetical protein